MRISKIQVEGFGVFSSPRSFDFGEKGLNVVFGSNESGKSTLMEAVYATLFGFETKDDERNFKSWAPSNGFSGAVEFADAHGTVLVSRDFSSNEVAVVRTENGESTDLFRGEANPRSRGGERRVYAGVLLELLGFSEGTLARKTSFVGQMELDTEFTPELRRLVSGGGPTDYHGAVGQLREKFSELTMENPWGTSRRRKRAMEETLEQLEETRGRLREAERLFRDSGKITDRRLQLEKETDKVQKEYDGSKNLFRDVGRLIELQNKVKDGETRYERELRAKEDHERVEKTCETEETRLEKEYSLFVELSDDLDSVLKEKLAKGGSIEDEIAESEKALAQEQARVSACPPPVPVWLVAAVPVLIFLTFLVIGIAQGRTGMLSGAGTAIAVLFGVGLWLFSWGRKKGLSRAKAALAVIEERLARLGDDVRGLREEVGRLFPEAQRSSVVGRNLRDLLTQHTEFSKARTQVERLKESLLSREGPTVHEELSAAVKDLAVAKSQLEEFLKDKPELLPLKDEPERTAAMSADVQNKMYDAEERLKRLDEQLGDVKIEHAGLSSSEVVSPEVYQEEAELLERKLSRLTLRRDALKLAVETLQRCVEEYQADSMERISSRISDLFGALTEGRYEAVRLSEGEAPLLATSSRADIDVEQISTGAQDQLYFCMRIAMLEELSGERGLPLMLDDPFVNFDDERLERARKLLLDLVAQRDLQVIIFTHGERHLDWPAHVIRLAVS